MLQLDDNLCDGRLKQMVVVSGQGRMTLPQSSSLWSVDFVIRFRAYTVCCSPDPSSLLHRHLTVPVLLYIIVRLHQVLYHSNMIDFDQAVFQPHRIASRSSKSTRAFH